MLEPLKQWPSGPACGPLGHIGGRAGWLGVFKRGGDLLEKCNRICTSADKRVGVRPVFRSGWRRHPSGILERCGIGSCLISCGQLNGFIIGAPTPSQMLKIFQCSPYGCKAGGFIAQSVIQRVLQGLRRCTELSQLRGQHFQTAVGNRVSLFLKLFKSCPALHNFMRFARMAPYCLIQRHCGLPGQHIDANAARLQQRCISQLLYGAFEKPADIANTSPISPIFRLRVKAVPIASGQSVEQGIALRQTR